MKNVSYLTEGNERLYDTTTIKQILGVSKSKIQREIKKLPDTTYTQYKNQHLYYEKTLLHLMEKILFERLYKIELQENELQKD